MDALFIGSVIVAALFWGALEVFLIATNRETISGRIRRYVKEYPPLGFLIGLGLGLMCGHFFWCA